jgi:hypothetical protein
VFWNIFTASRANYIFKIKRRMDKTKTIVLLDRNKFRKIVQSVFSPFQAILSTFRLSRKKSPNKSTPGGQDGPTNFFYSKSYLFCNLKPHAKFQNPTITPSGRKVTGAEREKKERKKTPLIVDTYFRDMGQF